MAKYSSEFKRKVVEEYLNGKGSYNSLAGKYGIPSSTPLKQWVKAYEKQSVNGLMRIRKKQTYSFNFKLHVVELYLTTEVSYQELALQVGITNPAMINKWVNNFRIADPDALREKDGGPKWKNLK